jgi:hypothetical protein
MLTKQNPWLGENSMPTSLVDHSSERKGEVWGGFGIGCILKQYFTGTVCFPAGAEFGCGDDKEVGVEKEESLELKIGAEKHGVGVDLTVGTKTDLSQTRVDYTLVG